MHCNEEFSRGVNINLSRNFKSSVPACMCWVIAEQERRDVRPLLTLRARDSD